LHLQQFYSCLGMIFQETVPPHIRGTVIKFVDCGFIIILQGIHIHLDPHRPSK
jgi:hypothetical protein